MRNALKILLWLGVILLGVWAYLTLALHRGETINSACILVAALCSYAIGFRFYSKWIAARVLFLDDRRATPCEVHDDGKDYVRTNKWIVFGHHFAAISGPGPLVGPVLAAQFGYLPGTLWILIGAVLGGAVQDFVVLFCSIRRDGRSLGQMVRDELNTTAGVLASVAILAIMVILLAVLALVVVKALAESPWGVFTVAATIPIAMFMGGYLRFWRVGRVLEVSVLGIVLLLLAVWGGQYVHGHETWRQAFKLKDEPLAWAILGYGLAASILPVWLLLAPRDYLSTFMKLGTILALVIGVFLVLPDLRMPALSRFIDGSGLVVAGRLFPFCFITIACGAISGFHTLIASGTTPKLITRESYARTVGYGAMCLESLVAIMAMVAACTLDPGVYLGMNVKVPGPTPAAVAEATARKVTDAGFPVSVDEMQQLAARMGEDTLFGRTGGAATLAVGMAQIFSRAVGNRGLDLWYHFAIMFEALFILTTLDAGTRVGRYLLQDALGNLWKPLGNTRNLASNLLASLAMVGGWGFFLIQGVRDPEGGVKALWPLFGIANQMLAAIALCLATTVLLKMHLPQNPAPAPAGRSPRPWVAAITLVPLAWLLAVTLTAGAEKVFHPQPHIGFLSRARVLDSQRPALEQALAAARTAADSTALEIAQRALRLNRQESFNQRIDAFAAGFFMVLTLVILGLSVREWIGLWRGHRAATLHETPPVWLPEAALASPRSGRWLGWLTFGVALARELSSEAALDRAQSQRAASCCQLALPADEVAAPNNTVTPSAASCPEPTRADLYVRVQEERYRGVRRCC